MTTVKQRKRRSGRSPRSPESYRERTYRQRIGGIGLVSFAVVCQETDLLIQADKRLEAEAREAVLDCRSQIEGFILREPEFATTLAPWRKPSIAPEIVRRMIEAGNSAGVGPMAAVAGAIAESVGRRLLCSSEQVVVENGGDIFLKSGRPVVVGLFAGHSPLSLKLGIRIPPTAAGLGICTSSGTVGHSLSAGCADAVSVISSSCALADAAATAIGNRIRSSHDIEAAIAFGRTIAGVDGIITVVGNEMGAWGQIELLPLNGKKG